MKKKFTKLNAPRFQLFSAVFLLRCALLLFSSLFFTQLNAQVTTQDVDMTWGWYWKGTTTNFDYAQQDLVDQIIYDDGIYFVGRTAAATSTATFANCTGNNILMGDSGDAYLGHRDLCGNSWTSYFGFSTAKEYAYCIAEDKVSTKTFVYTAGEINYTLTPLPFAAKACVGSCTTIYQANRKDGYDGYIAKYDANGKLMRWTYFGGNGLDQILGIVVDPVTHDVFVTGYTESTNLGTTAGGGSTKWQTAFDSTSNGTGDIFIAQFDSCLNTLKFFSYYGLDGYQDRPHGLGIYTKGADRYLVLGGNTESPSNQVVKFAIGTSVYDNQYGTNGTNGGTDGFVMKWNKMTQLTLGPKWCTYFGGTSDEHGRDILIIPDGSIYFVGFTGSDSTNVAGKFHATSDELQKSYKGGGADGFIAKFDTGGTQLKSFTFFGGTGKDYIKSINLFHSNPTANNNADSIAIAGLTTSDENGIFPLSSNANKIKSTLAINDKDAFFSVITGTGSSQVASFSSYVGGAANKDDLTTAQKSYGPSIALGPNGVEYIAFSTLSSDVKTKSQVNFQTGSFAGGYDAYIGTIYPFVEHWATPCPTCNPCRIDGSENSYDYQLEFYPVPFNNEVSLRINAQQEQEAMLRIYNSMGQEILRQKISVVEGTNVTVLNFQDQPSGIYFCRIEIDNRIETAKIIKE
ncbi:MAG: T9SS type A sorting domain-containing protein [Chitinophagales bacterium]|nr:T9SS type A sorting domain-containing protein [Chitinophagales bacterium]